MIKREKRKKLKRQKPKKMAIRALMPGRYSIVFLLVIACKDHIPKSNTTTQKNIDSGKQIVTVRNKDGLVDQEFVINIKGQKDGYLKTFFKNGKVKGLYNYSKDILVGEQQQYYANGSLQALTFYKNSVIDSTQKWFYQNGEIKSELYWINGSQFGVQKQFDSLGKLSDVYFMNNCDSCMSLDLKIDELGNIVEKRGSLISCVYNRLQMTIGDTLKAIFYSVVPDWYTYKCKLIEKSARKGRIEHDILLSKINNNMAYLVIKDFGEPGRYSVGLWIDLKGKSVVRNLSDSLFLPILILR